MHHCSEWCCSSLLWCVAVSLHKVACCLHGACALQLHGANLGCISQWAGCLQFCLFSFIHVLWYHSVIRQISIAWAQLLSSVKVRVLKWTAVSVADGHQASLAALANGGNRDVLLILATSCTLCTPCYPLCSLPPLCECN